MVIFSLIVNRDDSQSHRAGSVERMVIFSLRVNMSLRHIVEGRCWRLPRQRGGGCVWRVQR
jgi:hypothetical protein